MVCLHDFVHHFMNSLLSSLYTSTRNRTVRSLLYALRECCYELMCELDFQWIATPLYMTLWHKQANVYVTVSVKTGHVHTW